jgi:arginase family enzyme
MTAESRAFAGCHVDLDGAWFGNNLGVQEVGATEWGPQLRFSAPPRLIEQFYREVCEQVAPYIVYGSGDFHHLSGLWVRRAAAKPLVVVSFDNHPDWDIRPPKWCCGSWINRALEIANVNHVSVWGCGNFECWWPHNVFGNRRAERSGRLAVHPWADGRDPNDRNRRGAIVRENWRDQFTEFVRQLNGSDVYVTIDLDCLRAEDAVTNWENGRFTVADVAWALGELRRGGRIVAGDICGAYSAPEYARRKQRFASEMDHPKLQLRSANEIESRNRKTLERLWPILTGRDQHDAAADQHGTNDKPER